MQRWRCEYDPLDRNVPFSLFFQVRFTRPYLFFHVFKKDTFHSPQLKYPYNPFPRPTSIFLFPTPGSCSFFSEDIKLSSHLITLDFNARFKLLPTALQKYVIFLSLLVKQRRLHSYDFKTTSSNFVLRLQLAAPTTTNWNIIIILDHSRFCSSFTSSMCSYLPLPLELSFHSSISTLDPHVLI